jgi:hypothetical protein
MSAVKKCASYLKQKSCIPRLTITGLIIYCANSLTNISERKFDWSDALINAVIISGLAFFSAFGVGSVAGLGGLPGLKTATVTASAQFFIFLALKRGIVQSKQVSVQ